MSSLIDGVVIKPLVTHEDSRGFFREVLRFPDLGEAGLGQLSHSLVREGVIKAWHGHRDQTQWTYVVVGRLHAILHDLRMDSPTYGFIMEFDVDDLSVLAYRLPSGVVHGYRCVKGPAHVIYVTSGVYDPVEEIRLPPNHFGYDWDASKVVK